MCTNAHRPRSISAMKQVYPFNLDVSTPWKVLSFEKQAYLRSSLINGFFWWHKYKKNFTCNNKGGKNNIQMGFQVSLQFTKWQRRLFLLCFHKLTAICTAPCHQQQNRKLLENIRDDKHQIFVIENLTKHSYKCHKLENILKLRLSNHLDGVAEGGTPFKVDQFHITSGIKPSIGYYHVEDRL